MRHIDSMSKLKDAVAFEWYAQRNPLVVYKEKAFQKFEDLINEIEFKVVKSMFSIKKEEEVSEENVEISINELENMMKDFQEKIEENKIENEKNGENILRSKIRV